MNALESAYQGETEPLAKVQMETTIHHMKLSKEKMIPLCGDTGFPVFFVKMAPEIFIEGGIPTLAEAIEEAAVLRKVGDRHPEESLAQLELELLEALNMTGVGPLGMGGKAMALDVHIEYAMGHLAGFSAAVSVQCPAARVATYLYRPPHSAHR